MRLFQRIVANTVFFFNILIIFLLLFRERLEFPFWVQALGRMHPLLLHLPIGMLVVLVLVLLFKKHFEQNALNSLVLFIVYLSAVVAAVTAFMGLVLSGEGGYNEALITPHMISGVMVSFLSWILLVLIVHFPERVKFFYTLVGVTTTCLIISGHLGASMTHGENFLFQPLMSESETALIITDSTSLYEAAIYPVFKTKCVTCHNEKKAKGDLIMTSLDKFMLGGENGAPWVAGDAGKSLFIKHILLPEDHDDHMPPSGKPQLTIEEVKLLHQWVESGADTKTAWTKFNSSDSIRLLSGPFIQRNKTPIQKIEQQYKFAFASSKVVEKLNTPFLTVSQFSVDEPALKADFFLRQAFDRKTFEELLGIKDQLVILNLSNMPVTDEDCKIIDQFKNLEKLNLNNTEISGKDFSFLKKLSKLKSLSLTGTKTDAGLANTLDNASELREVFVWNTLITDKDVEQLRKQFPGITWDNGFIPDKNEILRLTPPILVSENTVLEKDETISLKHNLPGTLIRYTLDGLDPDSTTSALYKEPIQIDDVVLLKARACKAQWYTSGIIKQYFFKKGFTPTTAKLINAPDKDYKGEGAATLINNKKGTADNHRDIAWIGYHEQPMIGLFYFKEATSINRITLSYAHNIYPYLMPPATVEVWGGNELDKLALIQRITPPQPKQYEETRVEIININMPSTSFSYYKIIAKPVAKLPAWHQGKGQKGWVFLDEIFFY